MKKSDFIWCFNASALGNGWNSHFSLEYNLPKQKNGFDPASLVDARIWLIARNGNKAYLFAAIVPGGIEIYEEGAYKDYYLIKSKPFSSIRFLPRFVSKETWSLAYSGEEGLWECLPEVKDKLLDLIDKNKRVNFSPPEDSVINSVPKTRFLDADRAIPDQLALVIRTVALGDVSCQRGPHESLSGLALLALHAIKKRHPQYDQEYVFKILSAIDPMVAGSKALRPLGEISDALACLPPLVDTYLEEIDPDKISARSFVAAADIGNYESMEKTTQAEKLHQEMLKDFVLYLNKIGYKTYKSESYDLVTDKAGEKTLWEIKSANGHNLVAQGEKGFLQLMRYSAMDTEQVDKMKLSLLMTDTGQLPAFEYLTKFGERLGVELWLYSGKKTWPQKVSSFRKKETIK